MSLSMHNDHLITPPAHLFNFYTTHPPSGTFQPYQDKRSLLEEPPSPISMDNASNLFSPVHDSHSDSPLTLSGNLNQHATSLHPQPSTSLFPKRQCRSLLPSLRQLKNCCPQQILRSDQNSPMVDNGSCSSLSTYTPTLSQVLFSPSQTHQPSPKRENNTQDQQIQTEPVLPLPDIPTVDNKQRSLSTKCDNDPTFFLATPTFSPPILGPAPLDTSSLLSPTRHAFLSPPFRQFEDFHGRQLSRSPLGAPIVGEGCRSPSSTNPEKSPMAQLIQEYSSVGIDSQLGSTVASITWVLSLEELIPDLIVDRGEGRPHRYHLAKATMDDVCMVVTAQQTFIQQAAALIVEGKPQFIVDPRDTLIHILQGTSSLPQLHVAWKVLISRMRLGVKTWEKYIAEYQLQVGATAHSPLSTLHC